MTARDIVQIAQTVAKEIQYQTRTHLIAQVVAYDEISNTVDVQPVVKAVRVTDPDNPTIALPVLTGVPVIQVGSGKLWCTVAPLVDTYGLLHISDRIIGDWMELGGVVEPTSIRCHDISDAIFQPSMLPLVIDGDNGAFDSEDQLQPVKIDRVSLRTRTGITEISVIEDETIQISNEKAHILIDVDGNINIITEGILDASVTGDVTLATEGNVSVSADGDVSIESGGSVTVSSSGSITMDNGSGTIEIGSSGTVDINGNLTVDP